VLPNTPLPNPRVISSTLCQDNSLNSKYTTHLVALLGQFIAHDITSQRGTLVTVNSIVVNGPYGSQSSMISSSIVCPCNSKNPDCFSVPIPLGDILPMTCMEFVRSAAASTTNPNCSTGFREQINELSSFLDGEPIYGSTLKESFTLRQLTGGLLIVKSGVSANRPYLPQTSSTCSDINPSLKCFLAGEKRVNENMGLTSLHTLWLREHNRIATVLAVNNPTWNDTILFMETRRIVVAAFQHIVYKEFLAAILQPFYYNSEKLAPLENNGTNENQEPSIDEYFGQYDPTVIFRVPHYYIFISSLARSFPNIFTKNTPTHFFFYVCPSVTHSQVSYFSCLSVCHMLNIVYLA
jgi:peroxidase